MNNNPWIRPADEEPRCWYCGVEPIAKHDITVLGDPWPRFLLDWPHDGDHDHALVPPTPGQLLRDGAARFDRIMRIVAE